MLSGLSTAEAQAKLQEVGLNIIEEQKKRNFLLVFLDQFNNFLTILLLVAALFSFFIGERIDGSLILSIVILNALFGIYQEKKADQAIAALKKMTVVKVRVMRDGAQMEIQSEYLVPGDMVFIEEGTKISADGVVEEGVNLEINEAALTGESLPVLKVMRHEVYMGTVVVKGRGYFKVTFTGMRTKFGKIASELSAIDESETPLQQKLTSLSKIIGIAGILISVVVFVLSLAEGSGYFPSFLLAISLAVAVVPEGLPAVMTITLAMGVKEMAKKGAIVRKLSAIEALGSVTLIATDKTGTLTTNKMRVKEVYVGEKIYEENKLPPLTHTPFAKLILNGILCSTASLVYIHDHGGHDVLGDPTEGSLLYLAQQAGLIPDMVRNEWELIDEMPFDSITKRMTVQVKKKKHITPESNLVFSKGAPESILEMCRAILIGSEEKSISPSDVKNIEKVIEDWAKKGLRVLAFGYKKSESVEIGHITDLTFLGLVAIHDPPRPEAKEAILRAHEAGIKTIMITGDNEKTAEAIGVSTGLIGEGDEILTGKQVDEYSDEDLLVILPRVRVFARTTPFHKSRIVKLYQRLGEVVVVTGDGVNDAIALKQADVGVAMGLVGTDVARETADMVITDDNFATIVNAVEEGRNIIKNVRNATKYLLACNISEALALIVAMSMGIPHLFYAIQLLYINLVTDGIPALALSFSPREEHSMKRYPEKKLELLTTSDIKYIGMVGIIGTILVVGSFFLFRTVNADGRTAAFTVLALIQSFIFIDMWLSHRSIHTHLHQLKSPLFLTAFIVPFVLQYDIVRIPFLASVFKIGTVSIGEFLLLVLISSTVLIGIKGIKIVLKK
ncbi:MAG: cation-translocating P-type ATPase [bacterium]|nr:cation-translocating P-type ATPase [bacterium]